MMAHHPEVEEGMLRTLRQPGQQELRAIAPRASSLVWLAQPRTIRPITTQVRPLVVLSGLA